MNSIKQIDYEAESLEVPEPFASLIKDADERWDKFWAQKLNKRYPRYVASEPAQVYAALKHVRDEGLALGERFIEWGSGFGVVVDLLKRIHRVRLVSQCRDDPSWWDVRCLYG